MNIFQTRNISLLKGIENFSCLSEAVDNIADYESGYIYGIYERNRKGDIVTVYDCEGQALAVYDYGQL